MASPRARSVLCVGGDDHKAVMLAVVRGRKLSDRGAENRRAVAVPDQVGLLLGPALITPIQTSCRSGI